jgi:hypothetical protein
LGFWAKKYTIWQPWLVVVFALAVFWGGMGELHEK